MPEINTQAIAICPTCKGFCTPVPVPAGTIYRCTPCVTELLVPSPDTESVPTNIMETCSPGGNCFNDEENISLATEDPELLDIVSKAMALEDDGPNILHALHDPTGASIYRDKLRKDEGNMPLWMRLTPRTNSGKTHHDPSQVEDLYASAKKAGIDVPNIFSSWPDEPCNIKLDMDKAKEKVASRLGFSWRGHKLIPIEEWNSVFNIKPGSPASFFKSGIPLQIRSHTGAPMPEQMKQHDTGAVRSSDADNVAYHLISPVGLRRIAETYAEGSKKYGDYNWEKGFNVGETLNNTVRHVYMFLDGDSSEDHLAHAAWNLIAVMHFQERMPHLLQDLRPAAIAAALPKKSIQAPSFQESVATPSNWDIADEIQKGLKRGESVSVMTPKTTIRVDTDNALGVVRSDFINRVVQLDLEPGVTVAIGDLRIKDRVVYSVNNPTLTVHAEPHIDIPKAGS